MSLLRWTRAEKDPRSNLLEYWLNQATCVVAARHTRHTRKYAVGSLVGTQVLGRRLGLNSNLVRFASLSVAVYVSFGLECRLKVGCKQKFCAP
ncbi:hypothetical protein SDJN03_14638, partial [Cucurbita argyrosperma subsp. sororia]